MPKIKVHKLDRTKSSLTARIGTACGIRLKEKAFGGFVLDATDKNDVKRYAEPVTIYFAQDWGAMAYTLPRAVIEHETERHKVTCLNCRRAMR